MQVDVKGFDEAMEKQRAEARKNWAGSGDAGTEKVWFEIQDKLGAADFLGYNTTKAECLVKALIVDGKEVDAVNSGEFYLVANQTPFYGEMGGQVGDIGKIYGSNCEIEVTDTKKKLHEITAHVCKLVKGEVKVGDTLTFAVDEQNRADIAANHTVTHILHKVLRDMLGTHVTQKGSYVAADRMRFDISHHKQISDTELREAENRVNQIIRENHKVITRIMNQEDAISEGAMALFGEKYGDEVRVVSICDQDDSCFISTELCGGTHV